MGALTAESCHSTGPIYITLDLEGGLAVQLLMDVTRSLLKVIVSGTISTLSSAMLYPEVRSVEVIRKEGGEHIGFIWRSGAMIDLPYLADILRPEMTNEEIKAAMEKDFIFRQEGGPTTD